MKEESEIISIFPTPIYVTKIPKELLKNIQPFLDQEVITHNGKKAADEYGSYSKNTYILNDKKYYTLSDFILQKVTSYAEDYLSYNYKTYKFSQSWISIKLPNQEHKAHTHSYSLISGVLFYGDYKDQTSCINFHRDDNFSNTFYEHKTQPDEKLNIFSYSTHKIYYQPNLLILFPSSMLHSVSKNTTNIPRKSLAFNVIPKEGFGQERSLNQLKY